MATQSQPELPMPRLKGLSQSGFWPSGNARLYYRRAGSQSVPLPDLPRTDAEFLKAYAAAARGEPLKTQAVDVSWIKSRCLYAVRRARQRAKQRGLPFEITSKHCLAQLEKQKYRCALTNRRFSDEVPDGSRRLPFSPSLDQITPGEGYTIANSRIVCLIVNTSVSDFGDDAFLQICRRSGTIRERIFQPTSPIVGKI